MMLLNPLSHSTIDDFWLQKLQLVQDLASIVFTQYMGRERGSMIEEDM